MALSIKSDEADGLARELAHVTGESLTATVTQALRERLERERRVRGRDLLVRIHEIQERVARLPVLDDRPADEILGYNEHGHFD
ncbi:type II toxin-antitoxin system VapB family antitoxin [Iamia sp.]|uniref:type II toxin-antitoxin system VapB family antitoxin n=1 Tax=Iamia sp. TaxID=2722710 RepID=UPI002C540D6D|nr:type II toxin-antitoxin system VapB family antitoxin [Iamia sp.]HXH57871.1 type II toxin-antitoxin system VapB family antitoxin [Iamia sp.]